MTVKTLHNSLFCGTVPTDLWLTAACRMHQGPQVDKLHMVDIMPMVPTYKETVSWSLRL